MNTLNELDPFEVKVRMPATKQALYQLIGGNEKLLHQLKGAGDAKRVRIQSTQKIEPRKICHRILKDRSNIAQEIILDLQSVWDENQEAVRFATTWLREGREAADRSRVMCREDYEGIILSPSAGPVDFLIF